MTKPATKALHAEPPSWTRLPPMLQAPHRPFFLAAGLFALVGMALWLAGLRGLLPLGPGWHGHEMLFGFAAAALAGFLLTAAPNWTGRPPPRGFLLAGLAALWLLGRLGMLNPAFAWLDALFLPSLAALVGHLILSAGNRRNLVIVAVVLALAALNIAWHLGHAPALGASAYLFGGLIALIGGRIVPAFTQNAIRSAGDAQATARTPPALDRLAVPVVLAVPALEVALPGHAATGGVALAAGVLLLLRMRGWLSLHPLALRTPLVWILHVGYLWVPVALLLKAAADLGALIPVTVALHAMTAGAIGTMILAVTSRAALGHAGRPLRASAPTVAAYVLVIAAALTRLLFPYGAGLMAAGALWCAGWALFSAVYWPILTRPRADGRPG